MFICIGDNDSNNSACGKGETVEKAIEAWSIHMDDAEIFQEFSDYAPEIYHLGPAVKVEAAVTYKVVDWDKMY